MGVYSNNPDYWSGNHSGSRTEKNEYVEISGIIENAEMFGRLMTSDYELAGNIRKAFRQLLREARNRLSKDAKNYMREDPRGAARAVKFAVYKTLFGGNLSILQKRRGTAVRYTLQRTRKVEQNPHQRGGNRRPYDEKRNRLDTYKGADRGFILRFISSGTISRQTRYGNRGSIRQTDWFGHTAPYQMDTAATQLAESINEYIKHVANG